MTTAKPKKPKRGRPVYQENIRIDAPPRDVAKAILKKPRKPESEWRYLKEDKRQ